MDCVTHAGEKVFMVCKSCVNYPFACGVCVETDHEGHSLFTLRNAAKFIREKLENVERDRLQDFSERKSDLTDFSKLRAEEKEKARLAEIVIEKQDGVFKTKINATKQKVLRNHKIEIGKNIEAMDRAEEALKEQVSQIDTFQVKVAQLQKMNDYLDVIMGGREVEVPNSSRIPRPDIPTLVFTPGHVSEEDLGRMFGGITDVSEQGDTTGGDDAPKVTCCSTEEEDDGHNRSSDFVGLIKTESNIKVTTITSFNHSKNDCVFGMSCPNSGHCWLKCTNKNSVKLSNRSGQIKQAINLGTKTWGFTVTSDNRLLFCCTTQQCIKEMELPCGEIIEKFSTSPLTPYHICTCPNGYIYVILRDEDDSDEDNDYEDDDDVTHDSTVLVRYDPWGSEDARCPTDENDIMVFLDPANVCVNNSSTRVAVINHINNTRGELILLDDQDLSPILVYTGPSVLTGASLVGYFLTGVAFDKRDNILVSERYSKTVQLLSPSCEPLKILVAMNTSPWAMTLHGNKVWVGDNERDVHIFSYSY